MTAGQASHKRSYDRLYVERKRKERLAEGKCIACGSPERKVKKDGSFAQKCPSCASKALKRTNAYLKRRRPSWAKLGVCVVCGKREAMRGQKRCAWCAEKNEEWHARP